MVYMLESKKNFVLYMRNFIFGVEDSLGSTAGLVSGIAAAGVSHSTIVLTGVVLIFVEAFSMAVGSFLSEHSVEDYMYNAGVYSRHSIIGGLIMFFSYFVSGFIPLFSYIFVSDEYSFLVSIIASLTALFALGVVSAKLFKTNVWHHSLEMLLIGGAAVGIGITVGRIVNNF